jgi:adenylate kinase family enzyme
MKIAILGYSGSGKSTLAKKLGAQFDIPVLYLDTVQFEANWIERDRGEALALVSAFMRRESWVIDGNYESLMQNERLMLADYILFLTSRGQIAVGRTTIS